MRTILFKAKRADNGEWIEGNQFKIWSKAYILWGITNGVPDRIEVIPETVCQYTGLNDKNGVKVFESDRIKSKKFEYYIVFENGAFYAVSIDLKDFDGKPFKWMLAKRFEDLNTDYVVIGNIHDKEKSETPINQ